MASFGQNELNNVYPAASAGLSIIYPVAELDRSFPIFEFNENAPDDQVSLVAFAWLVSRGLRQMASCTFPHDRIDPNILDVFKNTVVFELGARQPRQLTESLPKATIYATHMHHELRPLWEKNGSDLGKALGYIYPAILDPDAKGMKKTDSNFVLRDPG